MAIISLLVGNKINDTDLPQASPLLLGSLERASLAFVLAQI